MCALASADGADSGDGAGGPSLYTLKQAALMPPVGAVQTTAQRSAMQCTAAPPAGTSTVH